LRQEYILPLEPLFGKVIELQSKIKEFGHYQYVSLNSKFSCKLADVLSSEDKNILQKLMKGVDLELKFALLNKLDDILLQIYKQYQEQQKKLKKIK
jgi:hypothetical protein